MGDKMAEKQIGKIFHYYDGIGVAAIEATGKLKVGDKIHVKGATTDFEMELKSMQIEKESVKSVKKGDSVGIKVPEKVRKGDKVFKV